MLSVLFVYYYTESHNAKGRYAECHGAIFEYKRPINLANH
jgi:hypothetical protein